MTQLRIEVSMDYALAMPGAAILIIETARTDGQQIIDSDLRFDSFDHFSQVPGDEGIGHRDVIRAGDGVICAYRCDVTVTRDDPDLPAMSAQPVEQLSASALRYLLPSRYCEAERFQPFVRRRFGHLDGGSKVAAIRDWMESQIEYVPGSSHGGTTAADTYLDGQGVCRDYAHLMIAMCRAAQIPARMCSVYAPSVQPPDFHAVVQVYLDHDWHLVDPSGMAQAREMAVIAVGRDATDIAFLTTETNATLRSQQVRVTRLD
ncbi:transglutaminase-like domain-containing protein [Paracoccus homiensis]|uniref:Transglutaminase-like superfamily protein n=1 Tax=Paracoccus homiensis TaxID=364199 RepID=A0A1I0DU86_9RHOB|nr:transglutaminase family protein [Paracoccus homiensis]SET35522.1 Transglutaminase-like superfamily protein [Paracoccus homiensis]